MASGTGSGVGLGAEHPLVKVLSAAAGGDLTALKRATEAAGDMSWRNARDDMGRSALHLSAKAGAEDAVTWLLEAGLDPNEATKKGLNAFHFAVFSGNPRLSRMLLEKGADVRAKDASGRTALHIAALRGHRDIAEWLVKEPQSLALEDVSNEGMSVAHFAAVGGHLDVMKWVLDKLPSGIVRAASRGGMTPLLHACSNGNLDVVQLLHEHGAELSRPDANGRTALHFAVAANAHRVAIWLLQNGVFPAAKDNDGQTPMDVANMAAHRSQAVTSPSIKALRAATRPPLAPSIPRLVTSSKTVLHVEWEPPRTESVSPSILGYDLQYGLKWSLSGWSSVAPLDKPLQECSFIITELEADTSYVTRVRALNKNGWGAFASSDVFVTTPVVEPKSPPTRRRGQSVGATAPTPPPQSPPAPLSSSVTTASGGAGGTRSLSSDHDPDRSVDGIASEASSKSVGSPPTDGAADEKTKSEATEVGSDAAGNETTAKVSPPPVPPAAHEVRTPPTGAAGDGAAEVVATDAAGDDEAKGSSLTLSLGEAAVAAASEGNIVELKRLTVAHANLKYEDKDGRTAMHHAALRGHQPTVEWLQGQGVPIDTPDRLGGTPLLLAIVGGHRMLAKWFVAAGSRLDATDLSGYGAVHYAVLSNNAALLDWLLSCGADAKLPAKDGKTPLMVAKSDATATLVKGALGPPSAPAAPVLMRASENALAVEWRAGKAMSGAKPIELWEVQYGRKFSPFWESAGTNIPGDKRTWTISGLQPETRFFVRVRARNAAGWSPYSSKSSEMTTLAAGSQRRRAPVGGAADDTERPQTAEGGSADGASGAAQQAVPAAAEHREDVDDAQALADADDDSIGSTGDATPVFNFADKSREALHKMAGSLTAEVSRMALLNTGSRTSGAVAGAAREARAAVLASRGSVDPLLGMDTLVTTRNSLLEAGAEDGWPQRESCWWSHELQVQRIEYLAAARAAALEGYTKVILWLLGIGDGDAAASIKPLVLETVVHARPPAAVDVDGRSLLHMLALGGHQRLLKRLAAAGGDTTLGTRASGANCLHLASFAGHVDVVSWLLDEGGASIDVTDANGWRALHYACLGGRVSTAKCLVGHGDSISTVDGVGRNGAHFAAMGGHVEVLKWIATFDDEADVAASVVAGRDAQRMTPLHFAVLGGHDEAVAWLLDAGADATAPDAFGRSPASLSEDVRKSGLAGSAAVAERLTQYLRATERPETPAISATDEANELRVTCAAVGDDTTDMELVLGRQFAPVWSDPLLNDPAADEGELAATFYPGCGAARRVVGAKASIVEVFRDLEPGSYVARTRVRNANGWGPASPYSPPVEVE